jgi:hypothetical protein
MVTRGSVRSAVVTALIPTLIAIAAGAGLGYAGGGHLDNLVLWRPAMWQPGVVGLVIQMLFRVIGISDGFAVFLEVVSIVLLLVFVVANIRVGGMIVIGVGLVLNLVPAIIDGGRPVDPGALVSTGIVDQGALDEVVVQGPRHLQTSDDSVAFLGDIVALPTRQVVSVGDLLLLIGVALVLSSLLRGRYGPPLQRPGGPGQGGGHGPTVSYNEAMQRLATTSSKNPRRR